MRTTRRLSAAAITGAIGFLAVIPAAQAEVRVGQNYRLASDPSPFRGKDQVALAVDPSNPNHIVETNANYLTESCEATASFDGGATWSAAATLVPPSVTPNPFQPSCRISNHLGETMFQTVAFGTGQNVYATSITPRKAGIPSGEEGASTLIFKSTDGGVTWGSGVVAMAGGIVGSTGSPYYELPTLAVDAGAGSGGADVVYSAARETTGIGNTTGCAATCSSVRIARSADGGQSFGSPVQASPTGVAVAGPDSASPPVIGADHSVGIAWRTLGIAGSVQFARSTDQAQTWSAAVNVTSVSNNARASGSHVTPTPATGSSFPRLAIDKTTGNLYIVYNQGAPGPTAPAGGYLGADHFITPDSQVYFQRSLDNGATWSTPKLIDDNTARPGTPTMQTRHPSVAVAPGGRVDVVWEDRRNWFMQPGERDCIHTHLACDDARLGDTYYAYSTNNGTSFSPNIRVSDRSHNNDVGYDYRFGTGWAFGPQSVAVGTDKVLIGWMDTREGGYDSDNQDIYLAKVDLSSSASPPVGNIDEPGPLDLSIGLSRFGYAGGGESTLAATFATRSASKVVVVNQDDIAGALAGSVLARANVAPVILSPQSGLSSAAKTEITRLNPAGAFVIGDTAHLTEQVVSDLVNAGIEPAKITRISGSDDGTARAIAVAMDTRTAADKTALLPAFNAAVIVNPAGPDAAAATGLAAARRLPILFASTDAVPSLTTAALNSLAITKTLVVGGPAQISDATMATLPSATRLGGADQYATSKAVATESAARGVPSNVVYVADGARPMDAALLGAVVGRLTGIMLLSPAPLYTSAATTASSAGLSRIDRIEYVGPPTPAPPGPPPPAPPPPAAAPPAAVPPPPPPPAVAGVATCGSLKLVRSNASRIRTRVDSRVLVPCAGKLTASASTVMRVKGKLRATRLTVAVRSLTGRNRAIRLSLSSTARLQLRRTGKLTIKVKAKFVPTVRSAKSKVSRKTITVIVRQGKR